MLPQDLNQPTYALSVTSTSAAITMTATDMQRDRVIINNLGSNPCLVAASGKGGSAATAAIYPTSATVPAIGQVVPAGAIETFMKQPGNQFISAICSSGLTTTLMISPATGD